MWKVEVRDGGDVGTRVRVCPTLTSAIHCVSGTLKNPWAGAWSITGPDGETIAESLENGPVVCGPDHDEEHHAPTPLLHL